MKGPGPKSEGPRSKTSTVVDCYVLPSNQNIVTFAGRIENVSNDDDATERVGHAIVSAVLR